MIAADLLSQAEHDINAQSVLICSDENFARAVEEFIDIFLAALPGRDIAEKSWIDHGAIIDDSPADLRINRPLKTEHLEPLWMLEESMNRIKNAGQFS